MTRPIRIRASALIVHDEKLLLIKCHDEPVGLHYNIPGGGTDYGESLEVAVKREVMEETCAEVNVGQLLMILEALFRDERLPEGMNHSIRFYFRCELVDIAQPRLPDIPDEHQTGVEWIPIAELTHIPLLPAIGDLIQKVLKRDDPEPILYQVTDTY